MNIRCLVLAVSFVFALKSEDGFKWHKDADKAVQIHEIFEDARKKVSSKRIDEICKQFPSDIETCWRLAPVEICRLGDSFARNSFIGIDLHVEDPFLKYACLKNLDLRGAVFSGVYFNEDKVLVKGAFLDYVSFRGSDLRGASLNSAYLHFSDLEVVKLLGAQMREAYLIKACLRRACLYQADLSGAKLHHANFLGADLRDVIIEGVTDLSTTYLKDAFAYTSDRPKFVECGATKEQLDSMIWIDPNNDPFELAEEDCASKVDDGDGGDKTGDCVVC
ncbi:pentapeptide repeat-containing protein [Candidatus Dependentiae bacterium]